MAEYNKVYESLVTGPDDAVGAFAYVLYKQHKVKFIKDFESRNRRLPTPEEMEAFHHQNCLDTQLQGYKERGETLAQAFLNAGLAEHISRIEDEVRMSALSERFKGVETRLDEKKNLTSWFRDIGTNVVVNILTVLVVGAIFLGSKAWSDFNNVIDARYGQGVANGQKPTQSSEQPK
jgi:hypothetical protein